MEARNTTVVLDAYGAVLGLLTDKLKPLGFDVVDGPIGASSMQDDTLLVGVGDSSISWRRARAGLARTDETFGIAMVLSSWRGNDNLAECRAQIRLGLDEIDAACAARPAVPGVVDSLALDDDMLIAQAHESDGAVIEVAFVLNGTILR